MFRPINGGSKIDVGEGFICHLPPIPDKSLILNYNLPRQEQYWKRLPLPAFYEERSLDEEYRRNQELNLVLSGDKKTVTYCDPVLERYRRTEWHRRMFGVWFMNDGEPTFLTNHHYFYLEHCRWDHKENDGFPFFYEYSKINFYIRQWCEENPRSLGYLFVGPRAGGKTNEEIACIVNRATMFHNHRAALQSKHFENDAKGVLIQAKTVPLFNRLVPFFKPQFSHGTNPQEALIFTRPAVKGKLSRGVGFGSDTELNSVIFAAQPGEKALDTETLSDILEDEVGKTDPKKVADVYVRHDVNMKCVFRNHRKIGMDRKTTTVEEMNEGGDECHKIWKDSDPKIIDGNGYTTSKIHRHLISALDTDTSLEEYIDSAGKSWGIPCDKFGRIDRGIAGIKIQNDFDAVKHDLKKLSSRMRKSPRNETEAFIKDQSKSIFNIMKLTQRLEQIRNVMAKKPYVKGNLYWVKEKFGMVWWARDDHAGRFNCARLPDEFSELKVPGKTKILNNVWKEWGFDRKGISRELITPGNYDKFRVSTDPIKYSKTKDPRASKAGVHAWWMYDHLIDGGRPRSEWKTHNFFFEYCQRPDDPETYLEDLAMLCIFLGTKVLPERNIPAVNAYFEQNGLERLLAYPSDFIEGVGLDVQTQSEDAGYASTPEVIDYYTRRIIPYVNQDIDRCPFDETIEDWMGFDPTNPTKSHLTVSSGFGLVHAEKISNQEAPIEQSVDDWFDRFDNSQENGRFVNNSDFTSDRAGI